VHWTFDFWTSPNNLAILGLIAHWTSDKIEKQVGLGLRITGSETQPPELGIDVDGNEAVFPLIRVR
jgi:hypothetical protein